MGAAGAALHGFNLPWRPLSGSLPDDPNPNP